MNKHTRRLRPYYSFTGIITNDESKKYLQCLSKTNDHLLVASKESAKIKSQEHHIQKYTQGTTDYIKWRTWSLMKGKEVDETSSIENTKRILVSSLENIKGEYFLIDFINESRLAKPSFGFIHSIIKLLVMHKCFAKGLYSDDELHVEKMTTRKDKIMFLFKIISCASLAAEEPMMFFISPVQILCGKEVNKTRYLLTKLFELASSKAELMDKSIEKALHVGFLSLYKKAVKTRNSFIILQNAIRKHLRMLSNGSNHRKEHRSESAFHDSCTNPTCCHNPDDGGESVTTPKKKLRKIKILNGIKYTEDIYIEDEIKTETNNDNRSEEERKKDEIKQLETELRRKLKKISHHEEKLKEQVDAAKAKEELLKTHEERVKKLAEKLRRQQEKVKTDERRYSSEIDKMLLQIAEKRSGSAEKRSLECFDSKNLEFGDDLLKKACENPTITDLRLALEHKQRSLTKRSQRIAKTERELKAKAEEINSMRIRLQSLLEPESKHPFERRIVSPKNKTMYKAKINELLSEQVTTQSLEQFSESNILPHESLDRTLHVIKEQICTKSVVDD